MALRDPMDPQTAGQPTPDQTMVTVKLPNGQTKTVTKAELQAEVTRYNAAIDLHKAGKGPMPNLFEAQAPEKPKPTPYDIATGAGEAHPGFGKQLMRTVLGHAPDSEFGDYKPTSSQQQDAPFFGGMFGGMMGQAAKAAIPWLGGPELGLPADLALALGSTAAGAYGFSRHAGVPPGPSAEAAMAQSVNAIPGYAFGEWAPGAAARRAQGVYSRALNPSQSVLDDINIPGRVMTNDERRAFLAQQGLDLGVGAPGTAAATKTNVTAMNQLGQARIGNIRNAATNVAMGNPAVDAEDIGTIPMNAERVRAKYGVDPATAVENGLVTASTSDAFGGQTVYHAVPKLTINMGDLERPSLEATRARVTGVAGEYGPAEAAHERITADMKTDPTYGTKVTKPGPAVPSKILDASGKPAAMLPGEDETIDTFKPKMDLETLARGLQDTGDAAKFNPNQVDMGTNAARKGWMDAMRDKINTTVDPNLSPGRRTTTEINKELSTARIPLQQALEERRNYMQGLQFGLTTREQLGLMSAALGEYAVGNSHPYLPMLGAAAFATRPTNLGRLAIALNKFGKTPAIAEMMGPGINTIPEVIRRSLTFDNGGKQ